MNIDVALLFVGITMALTVLLIVVTFAGLWTSLANDKTPDENDKHYDWYLLTIFILGVASIASLVFIYFQLDGPIGSQPKVRR